MREAHRGAARCISNCDRICDIVIVKGWLIVIRPIIKVDFLLYDIDRLLKLGRSLFKGYN